MKKALLYTLTLLMAQLAIAQTTDPLLTLNTEMHTARINRISSDAAGKYILTCSNDKTAKLWDAQSGQLLQTYRPPIGYGSEGMLYACAISPNGKWVVTSGRSISALIDKTHDIYIFDRQSGILQQHISDLSDAIFDLEFSLDGIYLAVVLRSGGMHLYRTATFELIAKDSDYDARSYNVTFSNTGNIATVCHDGYIRLYDNGLNLIKKQKTTGGKQPFSLAFSPDETLLAVAYNDSPNLQVLDANSLNVLYEPDITRANTLNDRLETVAFSKDGTKLIVGGFYSKKQNGKWWYQIRIYENAGRGTYRDVSSCANTVMDIKNLPNGNIAYCGVQPDWGIIDHYTGQRLIYKDAELNAHNIVDRSHFYINSDGFKVGLTPVSKNPLTFDINTRSISPKAATQAAYKAQSGSISVTDWKNTYEPKLNGSSLSFLKQDETCRSIDIADDQQKMVFGTEWYVHALDAIGKKLWRTPTQSVAWAVNIAANGKVVAAALGDGTVRWYRMSDGELLLTLFIHPDCKRWVLWTPSGYYDASPGAEDLIGWHVNQGADREGLYYPISKFRDTYYRPGVVTRILDTQDEAEALRRANEAENRYTSTTRTVTSKLPPMVRILNPASGTVVSNNTVKVVYSIQSPNKEAITDVKVLVNGRPVEAGRGLKPAGTRNEVSVTIPSANCTISIIAENRFGSSPAAYVSLRWQGQITIPDTIRPNLYVLAIGVSDYDDDKYDLNYADNDAMDFVNELKKQEDVLYNQVIVKLLTDKQATKNNIIEGLSWIENETTQHDIAMIFFAGHGRKDNNNTFYYLPREADDTKMRITCVMKEEIRLTVANISGKVLVFMDACHSGDLMLASVRRGDPDINVIINELIAAENGAIVFSSSMGNQSSLEDVRWENGAFTEALIEGLSGGAVKDGEVTWKGLDYYITTKVKQLTNGQQAPTTVAFANAQNFTIAVLKK